MQIKIDCPQCGGDIIFDEEIEVVRCQYCGSTNQISGKSGIMRFMFPPRWTETQCHHRLSTLLVSKESWRWKKKELHLVYAPYWRTIGMVFHWLLGKRYTVSKLGMSTWDDAKELKTKIFDFSFPAYREPDLNLMSLGVRTSAIPLQLLHPTRLAGAEIVLPAEVSLQEAIKYSSSFLTYGFSDRNLRVEFADTRLVGEVYSVVYFPFWVLVVEAKDRGGLLIIDGVANRVRKTVWDQTVTSFFKKSMPSEEAANFSDLRLIPFTCPVCGWNLPFSPASKTHICPTCTRAWIEKAGSYQEVEYQLVATPKRFEDDVRYMPFWDMQTQIQISDGVLSSRSDLRKLLPNLPRVWEGENGPESIQFLIPAFKIRSPQSLSKLAHLFCVSPPSKQVRPKERLEKERFEAVCLADAEAKQLAQTVLISMVPRLNRRARNSLKGSKIKVEKSRLVYYPFYRQGIYFREANSNHAIQRDTVILSAQA
jgi:predicted Zn-ribbon and HTH transcriptional regulator